MKNSLFQGWESHSPSTRAPAKTVTKRLQLTGLQNKQFNIKSYRDREGTFAFCGQRRKNVQERGLKPFDSPQGGYSVLPEEDANALEGMDGEEDRIFSREEVKLKEKVVLWGTLQLSLPINFVIMGNL